MDIKAVQSSYARWAPIYDRTFGAATHVGRRRAVAHVNDRPGAVLEVGVGTGLSLAHYGPMNRVTGIDASRDMLDKARAKKREAGLAHVVGLEEMDARVMRFADDTFDHVVAMHILSVVPEPERVMAEMARVCKPGGHVVITNHFAHDSGFLALAARVTAPFADLIGWHSDFPIARVLGEPRLSVIERHKLPPAGMMTFLVLEKR